MGWRPHAVDVLLETGPARMRHACPDSMYAEQVCQNFMSVKTKEPEQAAGGRTSRAYEQLFEMIMYGRLPPGAHRPLVCRSALLFRERAEVLLNEDFGGHP